VRERDWSRALLWIIYLALLGVLLPHTAWAFGQFEPEGWAWLGWVAAVAFEGAIAAFTWRLKQAIEATPRHRDRWLRWRRRYANVYSGGLVVAIGVSSAANWAHAEEFGRSMAVFARYSVPALVYSVAFGAILPLCSLLFARILAEVRDTEDEPNEAFGQIRRELAEVRRALRESEARRTEAERAARFMLELAAEDKARRILAVRERWPELPQAAIATIAGASPSYVSDVLRQN
jgi:hypothetical protein